MPARRAEIEPGVVKGDFSSPLDNGRVRCDVCPRHCTLKDGQRAFCFVRQARDGQVVLTAYGRSTGFCVDPIEKKPLNHFLPGSAVLSFGTAGCNLGCRFCQNWDISKAREIERLSDTAYPDDIADAALAHGCRSVAFTYNDPVVFQEYAVDTAQACHDRGLKAVAVTAGYASPATRDNLYRQMDAINVDLKAFTERFYKKLSFAQLGPVLDTLLFLKRETDVWFEVTTLLIPGQNDSVEEVARLSDWVAENLGPFVPLHFSAFHPDFKMMDTPATPAATLKRAREQARAAGLFYVYTGNIHDRESQSTYCHACHTLLIGRDWYRLEDWRVKGGTCGECGAELAGLFESQPGGWGARRLPIKIQR